MRIGKWSMKDITRGEDRPARRYGRQSAVLLLLEGAQRGTHEIQLAKKGLGGMGAIPSMACHCCAEGATQ